MSKRINRQMRRQNQSARGGGRANAAKKKASIARATEQLVFEISVEHRGRDLYDHELARFAPKYMDVELHQMAALMMAGPRRGALLTRARILRRCPNATVTIFEWPPDLSEVLMGETADAYVPSRDGLTLVVSDEFKASLE